MQKEQEFEIVDLHTHILPGVDDGAADLEQAIQMLSMAYEDGIRSVFLTPHYGRHFSEISVETLIERFNQLSNAARNKFPDLKLFLGNEIHYEADIANNLESCRCLSLNASSYCLIEFRSSCRASQILNAVSELIYSGYTPIIAHAERYAAFLHDPALVDDVVDMGAMLQLNADSILGRNGFRIKFFCSRLLQNQQAHFVGSDAHDFRRRPPLLGACRKKVIKKYGNDYAKQLFYLNAAPIIKHQRG